MPEQKKPFHELLADHLTAGTAPGAEISGGWSVTLFAQKVSWGERTVRTWLAGDRVPGDTAFADIEETLFGEDPRHEAARARLLDAWEKACAARGTPGRRPQQATRPAANPIDRPERCWGRDTEITQLVAALTAAPAEGSVAVLVLGEGGIGKTTLKRHVAHHPDIQARFGPRIAEVALETAISGAQAMQDAIALALDLDPKNGLDAVVKRLGDAAPHLLLLDNMETPWEAAPREVEALLRRLAAVKGLALVASLRGTEACRGADWEQCHLGPLPEAEARRLFRRIAPRIAADDPHLDDFLGELGGNPLAIRLVAERAQARTDLAPLWREWQAQGPAAAPDRRAKPGERHESLARSIEFSLASPRLDAAAHRLFRLLGVLPAGIARDDLAALVGDVAGEAEDRLLRVGLAVERGDRLDLLPPVRRHAAAAQRPKLGEQHAWVVHYLGLLARFNKLVRESGWQQSEWERVKVDMMNFVAALRTNETIDHVDEVIYALEAYDESGCFGWLDDTDIEYYRIFDVLFACGNLIDARKILIALQKYFCGFPAGDIKNNRSERLRFSNFNFRCSALCFYEGKFEDARRLCLLAQDGFVELDNAVLVAKCLWFLTNIDCEAGLKENIDSYAVDLSRLESICPEPGVKMWRDLARATLALGQDNIDLAMNFLSNALSFANEVGEGASISFIRDMITELRGQHSDRNPGGRIGGI